MARFAHSILRKGASARTGAVTLIQRFGSALNLHIHFHMLFLDGVYIDSTHGSRPRFRWVKAPTGDELTQLTHTIAHRVARYLERQGLLVRDAGNSYLTAEGVDADPESPMNQLLGESTSPGIMVCWRRIANIGHGSRRPGGVKAKRSVRVMRHHSKRLLSAGHR